MNILVTHSEYNSLQSKMVFLSTFATKFAVRSLGLNSCNFWLSVLRYNWWELLFIWVVCSTVWAAETFGFKKQQFFWKSKYKWHSV